MPTIGLKNLYYAKLTKDDNTGVTYDTPNKIAKAIEANIVPTVNEAQLYADDGLAETAQSFGGVEVTLNVDDLPTDVLVDLLGHTKNADGVLEKSADDVAPYVAIGFQSEKSDGNDKYVWLLKGKFKLNEDSYKTKGDTPEFQTKSISATFMKREYDNKWMYQVDSGDAGVNATVITNWFTSVYEPTP
jgi:phi13 family phage major tail protein